MNERTPVIDAVCHLILLVGAALVCLPIYVVFVTGSLSQAEILRVPMSWLPGDQFLANMQTVLSSANFGRLLLNSFIIATGITISESASASRPSFPASRLTFRSC